MKDEDFLGVLASLPSPEGYSQKERYADFRKVFMGSPEGQRCFREILSWGHLLRPAVHGHPIDPYLTHVRDGEANIARKLLVTVTVEPPEPQTKTRGKKS